MADEIVYVPVPRSRLAEIYSLLGREDKAPGEAKPPQARFSFDLVKRMWDESLGNHRRLMRYLAARRGDWVYTSRIAEDLELEHGSRALAGMLGAFGRRAKHRYGGLTPWESVWDAQREEARLSMTDEVAAWVDMLDMADQLEEEPRAR